MSAVEYHRHAMLNALTDAAEQTAVERKANALAEAQVHATAMLAEQQASANLIAAFNGDRSFRTVGVTESGRFEPKRRWALGSAGRLAVAVFRTVRAALDVEEVRS